MATKKTQRNVIVTTNHRGVFYGTLDADNGKESVVLTHARNVIYWSGKRGFMGLASHGPEKDSRIGSTAQRITLYEITGVVDCTEAAVSAFAAWPEP